LRTEEWAESPFFIGRGFIFEHWQAMSEQLRELIEPVVIGLGFELWGLEYLNQGKHSVLKIYIDSDNGIDVDDCASVSRQVSGLMDVEEPLKGKYTLEVSSPGMDRRLFQLYQFEMFKGAMIKVSLRSPFEGKRKFTGLLCGVEDDDVVLRLGEEEILFPFTDIDRAQVVPEFD
jgi:ribosome maturation factor RimP